MNVNEIYPPSKGSLLKAADVQKPTVVTIEKVDIREFEKTDKDGTPQIERKIVLDLVDQDKAFALNKTNALTMAELFGQDTDNWAGNRIMLFKGKAKFQGTMVDSIQVGPA